jgi:hypothetical protein
MCTQGNGTSKKMTLEKAKEVAKATKWEGDLGVNFLTAIKAARRLAIEVERLEKRERIRNWEDYDE